MNLKSTDSIRHLPLKEFEKKRSEGYSSQATSGGAAQPPSQVHQQQSEQPPQSYQPPAFFLRNPSTVLNSNVSSFVGGHPHPKNTIPLTNLYSSYTNPTNGMILPPQSSAARHCSSNASSTAHSLSHCFAGDSHIPAPAFLSASLPRFNRSSGVVLSQSVSPSPLSLSMYPTPQCIESSAYSTTSRNENNSPTFSPASLTSTLGNVDNQTVEPSEALVSHETVPVEKPLVSSSLYKQQQQQQQEDQDFERHETHKDSNPVRPSETCHEEMSLKTSASLGCFQAYETNRDTRRASGTNVASFPTASGASTSVHNGIPQANPDSSCLHYEACSASETFFLKTSQASNSSDRQGPDDITSCQEVQEKPSSSPDIKSHEQPRASQHISPKGIDPPSLQTPRTTVPLDALSSISRVACHGEATPSSNEPHVERSSYVLGGTGSLPSSSGPPAESDDLMAVNNSSCGTTQESPVCTVSQLLLVEGNMNHSSAQHRKTAKKRRVTTRCVESLGQSSRPLDNQEEKEEKNFQPVLSGPNKSSASMFRCHSSYGNEVPVKMTQLSNFSTVVHLIDDLMSSNQVGDPMGIFDKDTGADASRHPSHVSDVVKQMCFRNLQRRRDVAQLNELIRSDRVDPQLVGNDPDQPPPLLCSGYELQMAHLAEVSERETKLLALQQHCFRLLKNIALCCQSWANHEGSYLWHVSFILEASHLRDVTSYSLIFEDLVCEIALRLQEAQEKISSMALAETSPLTGPQANNTVEEGKSVEVFKEGSSPSVNDMNPLTKTPLPVQHHTPSANLTDVSGALLTSLVHQVDSTTMAQCLVLLDGLRQHHDPAFHPLVSLQDTLSSFVALQSLHSVYQSPYNFLLGTCTRFSTASNSGTGRGGKRRAFSLSSLGTATHPPFSAASGFGLNAFPKSRSGTGPYARSKRQLNVPTTAPSLHLLKHASKASPTPTGNPPLVPNSQISDQDPSSKRCSLPGNSGPNLESASEYSSIPYQDSQEQSLSRCQSPYSKDSNVVCQSSSQGPRVNDKVAVHHAQGVFYSFSQYGSYSYPTKHEPMSMEDEWDEKDDKRNLKTVTTPYSLTPSLTGTNGDGLKPMYMTLENALVGFTGMDTTPKPISISNPADHPTPTSSEHLKASSAQTSSSPSTDVNLGSNDIPDLPRDPEAFRSQVKGVYYDDTSNRWCASWHERKTGKKKSRYFAVKKFGFSTAKTHAMDARLEAEESGECAPTNII